MKPNINHNKVMTLVVEANNAKDIHKIMEHFKYMSQKAANRHKNEYREALLQLGVNPAELE